MYIRLFCRLTGHRCLLKCRNEYITEARPLLKQNSLMFCSIALPASCGPRRGKGKASEAKDRSRGSIGFGRERKELWSCSQGCGACCKLDKGPAFATPEEILDYPDHVKEQYWSEQSCATKFTRMFYHLNEPFSESSRTAILISDDSDSSAGHPQSGRRLPIQM
ncbi:hypothetical protein MRB53_008228 [Persea americana]|uniref:Uncharacterized protein n=1 Tax=Persea americana TaxID=3435 RepID=A0ACC2MLA3_PERAE|nr:hypothetical protein MRB53_008228 [Persea americana]